MEWLLKNIYDLNEARLLLPVLLLFGYAPMAAAITVLWRRLIIERREHIEVDHATVEVLRKNSETLLVISERLRK